MFILLSIAYLSNLVGVFHIAININNYIVSLYAYAIFSLL